MHFLALDPVIGMGLLLIAAAPIGAMSNYYVNVARGDLALSVLLTGVTSLLAFVSAPAHDGGTGAVYVLLRH